MEALPSVGIAKEVSVTEILHVVTFLVRLVLGITTPRELHQEIMELCGSGEKRCDFRRLLERLFDMPGSAALVLKYLGECLAPTGLGEVGGAIVTAMSTEFGLANVVAVLLSVKFDGVGFEFSASQVHEAAAGDNPDMVHVLHEAGANLSERDCRTGLSPLHVAVTKEQLSVVQTLLDLGANPWLKDPQGRTPVDLAAENEKVKTAFVEYYEEVDITDKNQDELVLLFVRLGLVSRLTAVLQSGANLKRTDEEGNSCLHIAAAQGSLDILEILLQGGADVAAKNQAGNTSVWLAMEHKHEAAVEVLLQAMIAAGMDIDARYENARDDDDAKQGQTLLMRASALGLASVVSNLLVLGADVSAKDANKKDPIDHAANEDVKAAFAKHLAQVEITDQNKNGLLLVFSRHGMASRLPAVLQAGADLKHTDENGKVASDHAKEIKDKEKREAVLTVLADFSVMSAVALGKADLVAAAVAKGCNVDETDCEKNTCLHIAVKQGIIDIVRMLVEAGAG
jgi:ankyrin repeat protein